MSSLELRLFGALRVSRAGATVDIGLRKAEALLAYLAGTGQSHARQALAAMFWPEESPDAARANLRRALWRLNRALGEGNLVADRMQVGLARDVGLWVDVQHFRRCLAEQETHRHDGDALCPRCLDLIGEAGDCYTGSFLAGFTLPDCPAFDEWLYFQEAELRDAYSTALLRLAHMYRAQGEIAQAIHTALRRVALDPLHEAAHRLLMELYLGSGQKASALRQYDECVRLLAQELDVSPSPQTTALMESIQHGELAPFQGKVANEAAVRLAVPATRYELPQPPTSFIGRTDELADVAELLANRDCRLLTLVGSGGIGKTRLAIQAAGARAAMLASGAAFVPLAAVHESETQGTADAVLAAIADSVGLTFYGGAEPLAQVLAFLRDKELLLLLDNMEHLLDTTDIVTRVLDSTASVEVMVTSRERLNLRSEWLYPVTGMGYPQGSRQAFTAGTDRLVDGREFSAVALFRERAQQVNPVPLEKKDMADVVRICQLVEGMPLAVELAAAWTRVLSCRQIAEEIERGIDFLETDLQDVAPRHRSILAVFEHSWRLLPFADQDVFKRMAVFRGGFTREAAQAVTGATLRQLSALVDKSLVQRGDRGRMRLHALVREFAAEKLAITPADREATYKRHADYFAEFLCDQRSALEGPGVKEALQAVEADFANCRLCWEWVTEYADLERLNRVMPILVYYFEYRGLFREGERIMRRAASTVQEKRDEGEVAESPLYLRALGNLLNNQGWFAWRCGIDGGNELMATGVELLRKVIPVPLWDLAAGLDVLAIGVSYDDAAQAADLKREALALAQADGDPFLIGYVNMSIGQAEQQRGEHRIAVGWLQEGAAILGSIGEQRFRSFALNSLGRVDLAMGRYERAGNQFRRFLRTREEYGDRVGIAYSLLDLAKLAKARGETAQAAAYLDSCVELSKEIGTEMITAQCVMEKADLARRLGKLEQGAQLLANAKDLIEHQRLAWLSSRWHLCRARIDLSENDFVAATENLQLSLVTAQAAGDVGDEASAWRMLGHAAGAENPNQAEQAVDAYRHAWAIASRTGITPVAIDILVGWARLYARDGKPHGKAVQRILMLARRHPAADEETRRWSVQLLAKHLYVPGTHPDEAAVYGGADVWSMGDELLGGAH